MISGHITRASALVLFLSGLTLLFAADAIMPTLVPAYPPSGSWLGQVLGAALLGLANFNYFSRAALLGGIYGRPVVASNMTFYFVSAMVLLRHFRSEGAGISITLVTAVAAVFAAVYGWLLFRGPFERDIQLQRGAAQLAPNETNPTIRT